MPTALITGAGGGIGSAIAAALAPTHSLLLGGRPSARLDAALASLEFMVSIDIYINETTRHAHLILSPVAALERSHYDVVFHALAVRNTAKFGPPVLPPTAICCSAFSLCRWTSSVATP